MRILHAVKNQLQTLAPFVGAAVLASALIGLLSAGIVACASPSRQEVTLHAPELLARFDELKSQEKTLHEQMPALEAAVEAAVASPSPDDDVPAAEALAAANQELNRVEAELAPIEERVHKGQAEPVAGVLGAIHPALGVLLMAGVPLMGKRGRKLYGSAFRNGARGHLLTAAGDILKALGAQHSSPQPTPPADEPKA